MPSAAFFENCWEARLGFIHRPDFEVQLQAHFYGASSSSTDFAAVALRNVIFAAGYRSILAKRPEVSFAAAQKMVWQGYFQNALSVLTGLLLPPSRLMAVQALALMVGKSSQWKNAELMVHLGLLCRRTWKFGNSACPVSQCSTRCNHTRFAPGAHPADRQLVE